RSARRRDRTKRSRTDRSPRRRPRSGRCRACARAPRRSAPRKYRLPAHGLADRPPWRARPSSTPCRSRRRAPSRAPWPPAPPARSGRRGMAEGGDAALDAVVGGKPHLAAGAVPEGGLVGGVFGVTLHALLPPCATTMFLGM